jgi:hypothetical protein
LSAGSECGNNIGRTFGVLFNLFFLELINQFNCSLTDRPTLSICQIRAKAIPEPAARPLRPFGR